MSLYISGVSQLKTSQKKSIYIIKDAKLFRAKEVHGRKKKKDVMEFNKKANQKTIRIQYLE